MNTYTGKSKTKRRDARKQGMGNPWVFSLMMKCALMLCFIFTAFILRIHFNDETERLALTASSLRQQIHDKDLHLQNLKNKRARLQNWSNIQKKIAEYGLDLRPCEAAQVRKMKLYRGVEEDESSQRIYASNEIAPEEPLPPRIQASLR